MKIFIAIWFVVIVICILEGYFCTQFDPESKKYLENKKKNNN